MDAIDILIGVALVAATAFCATGIWALVRIVRGIEPVSALAQHLDADLPPLIDKASVTIDALNAELLRIDMIVSRVEDVTDRVSSTSNAVSDIVNAPVGVVSDVADRVRKAWKSRRSDKVAGGSSDPKSSNGGSASSGPSQS